MTETEKKQPVNKIRIGNTSATIWLNEGKDGSKYHTVTIERSYSKDGKDWKNTNSYGVNDLPKVRMVSDLAYEWVYSVEAKKERDGE